MKAGPAKATRLLIEEFALDCAPRKLQTVLVEIIRNNDWANSKTVAEEKAESWEPKVRERLRTELNGLVEVGIPPRLAFNASTSEYVQGYCFIEPHDSVETRDWKQRRLRSEPMHTAIKQVSNDEFERLCAKLLELLGIQRPTVTRQSADDGIDFFGKLRLKNLLPVELSATVQQQLDLWIVGQAKKYVSSQAGTPEIRDLVGAIQLGRSGAYGRESGPFDKIDIRVADPVFAMLVTAGSFSANAWHLLKKSGVVGVDGQMLAAFLADKDVGKGTNGKFEKSSFQIWLAS